MEFEGKVVHFNLFRPDNTLFKQKASTKAQVQTITCNNSEKCQFISRGECVCRYGLWGGECLYGRLSRQAGYTRRSQKYHSWCNEQRKKYDGVPFLDAPKRLGIVGNYVFLPYPHINLAKNFPWELENFVKREHFTADNIIQLVKLRPQAMMGGEIKDYQKEIPPLLLKHLSELMPELFQEVIEKDGMCRERYAEFSNIGRWAILQTLTPNAGALLDIYGGLWIWDGEELHSDNSKMSFGLCEFSKVSITPIENQKVKITDEGQVNENTVFVE